MRNICGTRSLVSVAIVVATGFMTYTGFAQEEASVIVEGTRHPKRSSTTGAPIETVTTDRVVSYSDISLTTESGVKVLETRIRDAATAACVELNLKYPVHAEGDSTAKCVSDAVDAAMAEAHKRINAAQVAASGK